ncbi:hypothetical protein BX666DRAFT_1965784 [Dichotomocladium elegans]|nr:hypothetical protein BX666DRAFT_1965784 [Dichotomocladium elegans]
MSSPATSTTSVSSIRDVVWYSKHGQREEHRERSLEAVDIAHATAVHAFSSTKSFLNELQTNQDFDIAIFLNRRFFF